MSEHAKQGMGDTRARSVLSCWRRPPFRLLPRFAFSAVTALLVLAFASKAQAAATNLAPMVPRATLRTNLTGALRPTPVAPQPGKPGMPQPGKPGTPPPGKPGVGAAPGAAGKTNVAQAKTSAGTNTVSGGKLAQLKTKLQDSVGRWRSSRAFYPVVGLIAAALAVIGFFAFRSGKQEQKGAELPSSVLSRLPKRTGKQLSIHACNVLHVGPVDRQLWQFDAGFKLNREQTSPPGEALPSGLVAKDWTNLWQRKLNIAWLPSEQVFLRVAQFPRSDFAETVAMVELQLEKLSPMPVAQVVWSLQILPHAEGDMQTVVVMLAARNAVEEFLGQLEGQGFLADRLEMPLLDQLQTTVANEDGAWIYPEAAGGKNGAVVAWWCRGVLQSLDLLNLPATERAAGLKEQLLQMAWAGELEGWLTSKPTWHLVADQELVAEWEPALREGLEQPIQIAAPLKPVELAGLTARRAASADAQANLLPPEFVTRYQQQFYDRLWMRGLGALVGLYLIGLLIYGVAVAVASYRTEGVEGTVSKMGVDYTNVLQLQARYQVLKDRQDLKFAALDCYKTVAELLPTDATLEGFNFSDGKRLALQGTAPADKVPQLYEFESAIRKKDLFDPLKSENLVYHQNPGAATVAWNLTLQLRRGTM